ncbi:MAG: twin-arginine translocation signal domain-containing protein, partial [Neisseriaceae bacterium]|nr:twin-arginine translocation signal domain-containing protein [Neisseriaceae bacterium]
MIMEHSTLNRRQFLKMAAAGSVVAALPFGSIQAETAQQNAHIVIMGCGLAGLAAAHRLR